MKRAISPAGVIYLIISRSTSRSHASFESQVLTSPRSSLGAMTLNIKSAPSRAARPLWGSEKLTWKPSSY